MTVTPNDVARPVVDESIANVRIIGAVIPDGEGDEAGEPEQHRQSVQTEHGDRVGEGGEEARGQSQVDEDEEGPDGGEDHEAVLGWDKDVGCDYRGYVSCAGERNL